MTTLMAKHTAETVCMSYTLPALCEAGVAVMFPSLPALAGVGADAGFPESISSGAIF